MAKIIISIIAFLLLTFSGFPSEEALSRNVVVTLNGSELNFDVAPRIYSRRTLVPVRAITEALGATVHWRGDGSIYITKNSNRVLLWPEQTLAFINGSEVHLDVPAKIVSGRTLVPIRFIAQATGAIVDWNQSNMTVTISNIPTIQVTDNSPTTHTTNAIKILSTQGQRLFIGMSNEGLVAVLGEPIRKEPTLYGYEWWIYRTQDGLLLVGVTDNKVVAIYTDSQLWKLAGITPGDSFATLSGMHKISDEVPSRLQEVDITIHLEPDVLKERPLIISNGHAMTFYLDTANARTVSAIRIMNMRAFFATGGYSMSWQTTAGRRLNFGIPNLSSAQRQLALLGQERIMFDLANGFRIRNGRNPLLWHDNLAAVAREHSMDMFTNNFFSHHSPQTGSPLDRVVRANIANIGVGENLVVGTPDSIDAHHGLLNSPGHRENMLFGSFTHMGVGIVGKYYTQKFMIQ